MGGVRLTLLTDDDGAMIKILDDGRVLRLVRRMYNTLLTISESVDAKTWIDGW